MIEQSQIQEGATVLIGGGHYGKLTGRMKFNHGKRKQTLAQVLTRHTKPNHRGVYNEIGHWVPLNQLTLSKEDFEVLWKAKAQDEEHKGDAILTEETIKAIQESERMKDEDKRHEKAFHNAIAAVSCGSGDDDIDALVGINLDKEPITLPEFKKGDCPACDKGVLLGRRDNETFEFLKEDNCILCAQRFVYEKVPR